MLVYRITHKKYAGSMKASGLPGRWNGAGRKVIYSAGSLALAFIENMIRRQGLGFGSSFQTTILEIPDELTIGSISIVDLPGGWRSFRDYSLCQPYGNAWYDEGKIPILKVPSAVLPEESNFVLNTLHPKCNEIKVLGITGLIPDERIEALLKRKY